MACLAQAPHDRIATCGRRKEQFGELHRWHETTVGRGSHIMELKREVNDLLAGSGLSLRYPSVAANGDETLA